MIDQVTEAKGSGAKEESKRGPSDSGETPLFPETDRCQSKTESATDLVAGRTQVRFTKEEFEKIRSDAAEEGESLPVLLKRVYFGTRERRLAFHRDDAKRLMVDLARIGNNLNQIARRVNSGFREGTNASFEGLRVEFQTLVNFVRGHYGDSQDSVCSTR